MAVELLSGDCLDLLPTLEANSIDSVVTDPPYHLTTGKKGGTGIASLNVNSPAGRSRISTGFMGKQWDGGDIAFRPEFWAEVLRVMKPGAHLVAFGGSRTYHRMACAIEDAGFEIRDSLMWVYGTGFPKSHDVSKGIDKAAGAEREVIGFRDPKSSVCGDAPPDHSGSHKYSGELRSCKAVTDAARQWEGWGTALKPAFEPIVLARKPLSEGTVAANVLRWGTGALNIDGCRIDSKPRTTHKDGDHRQKLTSKGAKGGAFGNQEHDRGASTEIYAGATGRWPANVVHDGSDEVVGAFPNTTSGGGQRNGAKAEGVYGVYAGNEAPREFAANSGSAARFFYSAKASKADRNGSKHPTVKPIALKQWLARLITPPGGTVLDPFAGSGTTGEACVREGFRCVLMECEPEYQTDIRRRLARLDAEVAEAPSREEVDYGPLFVGS